MCRQLLTTVPLWILFGSLLTLGISSHARADESTAAAVSAIEKLGGSLLPMPDGLEVDFHLRGHLLTDEGLKHVAALQNTDLLTSPGQIGRGNQTVVTAANDYAIKSCSLIHRFASLQSDQLAMGHGNLYSSIRSRNDPFRIVTERA